MRVFGALIGGLLLGCNAPPSGTAPPTPAPVPTATEAPTAVLYPRPAEPARVFALTTPVYIRRAPSPGSPEIGALHLGAGVEVRAEKVAGRVGCAQGWLPVEPEGFVCLDRTTTRDENHPIIKAKRAHHANFSSATPHGWAESKGAPLYRVLPTRAEQRRWEADWKRKLEGDGESGSHGVPDFFAGGGLSPVAAHFTPLDTRPRAGRVPARSSIAFTDEVLAHGRRFLLTDDLMLVPKDRVEVQTPSPFRGVHLGGRIQLPIAFARFEDRPLYRFVPDAVADLSPAVVPAAMPVRRPDADPAGHFEASGESVPRLDWVGLTGRVRQSRSVRYLETREPGQWVRERDVTVIRPEPPRGFALADGEKWLDVSIFHGTLVAYEGKRAVFATLISPGAQGYKREDGKPAKYTTPTGTFRIEWKHRSTTMSPDPEKKSYFLSEVPFTQFFHMPFALHAAYWHDRFGEPKSGGCVNLSVADARWLFDFTEPVVPPDWHSVRSGDDRGEGTWVRVR